MLLRLGKINIQMSFPNISIDKIELGDEEQHFPVSLLVMAAHRKPLEEWNADEVSSWFEGESEMRDIAPTFRGSCGLEMATMPLEEFVQVCQLDLLWTSEELQSIFNRLQSHKRGAVPIPTPVRAPETRRRAPATLPQDDVWDRGDLSYRDELTQFDEKELAEQKSLLLARRMQQQEDALSAQEREGFLKAIEYARSLRQGNNKFTHRMEDGNVITLFVHPPANEPSDQLYVSTEGYQDILEGDFLKEVMSPWGSILDYPDRLFQICDNTLPPPLTCAPQREQLLCYMAKIGMLCNQYALVGGFIRDYLFRGVRPMDIDFRVPGGDDELMDSAREYVYCLTQFGIQGQYIQIELSQKHAGVVEGKFLLDGEVCKIDFVANSSFGGGCRVDFDVNNFQITAEKNIHQRVNINRPDGLIIENILSRKCVPVSSYNDVRVRKMQKKGWTVIF